MAESQGKELELDVTNIAHGGISVARHDGRVIFVSDAIPGERVLARITEDSKKSFWRAETVTVVEPSEHRQMHVWSSASVARAPENRAGGAEFGHIEIGHQRELKRQVVVDSLQRFAKIDSPLAHEVAVEAIPGAEDGTGWRTRVRLHVDAAGRPGPYAARSHKVIAVTELPLATAAVQEAAPLAARFVGEENVDIVQAADGVARLIVGDREFRLADTGFWQVHTHAAQTLTTAVQDAIDPALFDPKAHNLDLYGGVGLLAAAVADRFGSATKITSVESDATATGFASRNLAEWIGADAATGRVERWIAQLAATANAHDRARLRDATVVLDPPRSGAGKQVVQSIGGLQPAQIVYVACDPVALARDIGLFAERGYVLTALRAFDLFPHTHHVEAVATLTRR